MAKISLLDEVDELDGLEQIVLVKGGETFRAKLKTYIEANIGSIIDDMLEEGLDIQPRVAESDGVADAGKIPLLGEDGKLDASFTDLSERVAASAGAGDSGKIPVLNEAGKLDPTFTDLQPRVTASAGVADSGKIPRLNGVGKLDPSFTDLQVRVVASAGAADASKIPLLNGAGKLDPSFTDLQARVAASAGAGDASKIPLLDASGGMDPTIVAPDGYQRQKQIVLSPDATRSRDINFDAMFGSGSDARFQAFVTGASPWLGIELIYGDHNKGGKTIRGKTRAPSSTAAATGVGHIASAVGDQIADDQYVVGGVTSGLGHAGGFMNRVDRAPTNNGEIGNRFTWYTNCGLHLSEADPARDGYYAQRIHTTWNSKQQTYWPGKMGANIANGSDFGGANVYGPNLAGVGECVFMHTLGGSELMVIKAAGAHEIGPDGRHWLTDANVYRDQIMVAQIKADGDAGAVVLLAAAGVGTVSTAVWGPNCLTVTMTAGGAGSAGGDIIDIFFPHPFPNRSFATIQREAVSVNIQYYTACSADKVRISAAAGLAAGAVQKLTIFFQGN